ncbi:peptidoglycan-binding domain-containing protein [Chryseobacterium oryctis]|uniref:Peptidoglycan-binding protein n=1 Tax=Chryseobacterium oryctis TaxID=2952618 RepID=A0ABT3HRX8_9FLAO|nr:peptidoglycan-binding domain-containing protein [Chryseobacterium oryctis]MCW3162445.1 peptidoglycan-binding protein [Chryseobacterium oryctis]
MKKTQYLKELNISAPQQRGGANKKSDVEKIQSWLCLQEKMHPGLGTMVNIDGDFGPATENAVKIYQRSIDVPSNGVVTPSLFMAFTSHMKNAFEGVAPKASIRESILSVAENHLKHLPFELNIRQQSNSGPWVRSYMGGNEGASWLWCMGFVQTIIDQAMSLHGRDFTKIMPLTYSCDTIGTYGIGQNTLIRNEKIRKDPGLVKKGDILLIRKSLHDWVHTAIIMDIKGDTFVTIEGNTNNDGSSNGDGVYKRIRNFRKSVLDVFSLSKWI